LRRCGGRPGGRFWSGWSPSACGTTLLRSCGRRSGSTATAGRWARSFSFWALWALVPTWSISHWTSACCETCGSNALIPGSSGSCSALWSPSTRFPGSSLGRAGGPPGPGGLDHRAHRGDQARSGRGGALRLVAGRRVDLFLLEPLGAKHLPWVLCTWPLAAVAVPFLDLAAILMRFGFHPVIHSKVVTLDPYVSARGLVEVLFEGLPQGIIQSALYLAGNSAATNFYIDDHLHPFACPQSFCPAEDRPVAVQGRADGRQLCRGGVLVQGSEHAGHGAREHSTWRHGNG
jgi:hypothetical protein